MNPLLNAYKFTRMGVVSGIPTDMVDEDIMNFVSVLLSCFKVKNTSRGKIPSPPAGTVNVLEQCL